jgi:Zn finger protein HypA/HybF involved in hydrogenase expression
MDDLTQWLSRDAIFGLSLIELAVLIAGLSIVSFLFRKLFGGSSRRDGQIVSQTTQIRCHSCGWSGTASKHTRRCPRCNNHIVSA